MVQAPLESLQAQHAENYGWALACCAWQREQAEDVLQEAYLRVLDGRASFAGKSSHRTWFFAVIKHVAADIHRTQKRRTILNLRLFRPDPDHQRQVNDSNALAEDVYRDQFSRQLHSALMQLSERQREVLHLVFYADMTLEDAAVTLGITPGSVRTHYHRGKERLAQLLELEGSHNE